MFINQRDGNKTDSLKGSIPSLLIFRKIKNIFYSKTMIEYLGKYEQ